MKDYKVYKEQLKTSKPKISVLHYACSDVTRAQIEISSICLYKLDSHNPLKQFSRLDFRSEKEMLKSFWNFIDETNPLIVGWNINKPNIYGLEVLQKRYNFLSKRKIVTKLPKSYDLDHLLECQYKHLPKYDEHPKLFYYAKINNSQLLGFQKGTDELDLFRTKEYKAIDISVQRKCAIISDLLDFYLEDRLKIVDSRRIWKQKIFWFGFKQSLRLAWIYIKIKMSSGN